MNKKQIKSILGIITFGVLLFALVQNFNLAWAALGKIYAVFAPVVTGFCIAFVLNVLLRVLEGKVFGWMRGSKRKWVPRLQRPVSLVATILLTFGFLTLLLLVIIPELQKAILKLVENISIYVELAQEWLGKIQINGQQLFDAQLDWVKLLATVRSMLTPGTEDSIVETAAGVTTSVISSMVNLAFSFLFPSMFWRAKSGSGSWRSGFPMRCCRPGHPGGCAVSARWPTIRSAILSPAS